MTFLAEDWLCDRTKMEKGKNIIGKINETIISSKYKNFYFSQLLGILSEPIIQNLPSGGNIAATLSAGSKKKPDKVVQG